MTLLVDSGPHIVPDPDRRRLGFAQAVLRHLEGAIARGGDGNRNNQLAGCSFSLGRWVASDLISIGEAKETAQRGAGTMASPMDQREIDKTIAGRIAAGIARGPMDPEELEGEWRQVWREIRDYIRTGVETSNTERRVRWAEASKPTIGSMPESWKLPGTTWPSKEQPAGTITEWTWPELRDWLTAMPSLVALDEAAKLALPLWSTVRFRDGKRALGSVGLAGAIMIDLDSTPEAADPVKRGDPHLDLPTLVAFLTALLPGHAWLAHSSARSRPGAYRWRVVIPLEKPAWPDEYKALCAQLRLRALDLGSLALEADATAWISPARGYFVPAVGPNQYYQSVFLEGAPFSGDESAGPVTDLERQIAVATDAVLERLREQATAVEDDTDETLSLLDATLHKTKFKLPKSDIHNAVAILSGDPLFVGRLAWNTFTDRPELDGHSLADADVTALRVEVDQRYLVHFGKDLAFDAAHHVAGRVRYNPLQDYLNGLQWDGKPRIQAMLTAYFGAPSSPLMERYGARWAISAVARAFEPGCKVDTVLVLRGEQGSRKSSGLAALVPEADWFSDDLIDVQSKEGAISLLGKWIVEIAELESFRGKAQTAIKAFLSRATDHYRPVHGRATIDQPRQAVLVASTNAATFLLDATGSRRFWIVETGAIDTDAIRRDRDQLWAEAVHAYRSGEQWYLTREEEAERRDVNESYQVVDPWEPVILNWLDTPEARTTAAGHGVTTTDVMRLALGFDAPRMTRQGEMAVADILRKAGFERVKVMVNAVRAWRFRRR